MLLYIYTQCIYIYTWYFALLMCAMVKLDGTSSSWMVHTCNVYIYILMYNICVRYIYIYTSRTIDISLLIVQKCEGWFTADSKSTPKKDAGKWNQDGSPMICSHIFPAVLFVVSMTGGCFILYEISDWVSYDYQCLGHFLTLWNHD